MGSGAFSKNRLTVSKQCQNQTPWELSTLDLSLVISVMACQTRRPNSLWSGRRNSNQHGGPYDARGLAKNPMQISGTSPKTNMEPKNEGLEDDFPFQRVDFQVPC